MLPGTSLSVLCDINTSRQCFINCTGCLCTNRCCQLKLSGFVFQVLHVMAPVYLADDCQLLSTSDWRRLCSATTRTCSVPLSYSIFADRSFGIARPMCRILFQTNEGVTTSALTVSNVVSICFCLTVIEVWRIVSCLYASSMSTYLSMYNVCGTLID